MILTVFTWVTALLSDPLHSSHRRCNGTNAVLDDNNSSCYTLVAVDTGFRSGGVASRGAPLTTSSPVT